MGLAWSLEIASYDYFVIHNVPGDFLLDCASANNVEHSVHEGLQPLPSPYAGASAKPQGPLSANSSCLHHCAAGSCGQYPDGGGDACTRCKACKNK